MLMVPDWNLGWWGHPWCHWSSWYVIHDLCIKFQLSRMIWSVLRTPHPWSPYLKDIDGSWLETWRNGSSLMCWIILGDPQELFLKVWWRSDYIWMRYWGVSCLWQKCDKYAEKHSSNYYWITKQVKLFMTPDNKIVVHRKKFRSEKLFWIRFHFLSVSFVLIYHLPLKSTDIFLFSWINWYCSPNEAVLTCT